MVLKLSILTLIFFIIIAFGLGYYTATGIKENFEDNKKQGVPKEQIPPGDEDLYVLKSKIVPPVCPKCPDISVCKDIANKKCPPCPPCARCPEPSFECKKVPNYNRKKGDHLPRPILSDFSQFGM